MKIKKTHLFLIVFGLCLCLYWLLLKILYGSITFSFLFLLSGLASMITGWCFHHSHLSLKCRLPKWCYCLCLFLFMVICTLFCFIEVNILWQGHKTDSENGEFIVVLGAGLINGDEISLTLQHRLETALALYKQQPDSNLIVSGGKGNDESISEAEAMKQWLIKHGVKESQILCEDRSVNTVENILFVKDLLKQLGKENISISLVTSDFHMYRAKYLAEYYGFIIYAKPAAGLPFAGLCFSTREFFAVMRALCLHY